MSAESDVRKDDVRMITGKRWAVAKHARSAAVSEYSGFQRQQQGTPITRQEATTIAPLPLSPVRLIGQSLFPFFAVAVTASSASSLFYLLLSLFSLLLSLFSLLLSLFSLLLSLFSLLLSLFSLLLSLFSLLLSLS